MRIAAILFIVVAVVLNFVVDHYLILLLAIFSYPVLLWMLFRKRRPGQKGMIDSGKPTRNRHHDDRFDTLQEIPADKS